MPCTSPTGNYWNYLSNKWQLRPCSASTGACQPWSETSQRTNTSQIGCFNSLRWIQPFGGMKRCCSRDKLKLIDEFFVPRSLGWSMISWCDWSLLLFSYSHTWHVCLLELLWVGRKPNHYPVVVSRTSIFQTTAVWSQSIVIQLYSSLRDTCLSCKPCSRQGNPKMNLCPLRLWWNGLPSSTAKLPTPRCPKVSNGLLTGKMPHATWKPSSHFSLESRCWYQKSL